MLQSGSLAAALHSIDAAVDCGPSPPWAAVALATALALCGHSERDLATGLASCSMI